MISQNTLHKTHETQHKKCCAPAFSLERTLSHVLSSKLLQEHSICRGPTFPKLSFPLHQVQKAQTGITFKLVGKYHDGICLIIFHIMSCSEKSFFNVHISTKLVITKSRLLGINALK